jgi:peptidoglycan/LPS O-acetylase OafA/YrhL
VRQQQRRDTINRQNPVDDFASPFAKGLKMGSVAIENGRPKQAAPIQQIPELDGLRGLGILFVVLQHSYVPHVGLSWAFVDMFFALSGFLITSILLATKGSPRYFSAFYARRVLRIFPLYFFCLFAVFCVGIPIAYHFRLAHLVPFTEQLWYWLYISNWFNGLGHSIYYLSHFWSLAIEEQFYLVWPIVVFLLSRRALARCCLLLIGGSFLLRLVFVVIGANPVLLQRGTIFKMDTLAMGGLIAVIATSPRVIEQARPYFKYAAFVGTALLTIITIVWGSSVLTVPMIAIGYAAVACMSGYLIFYIALNTGSSEFVCWIFRFGGLRNLGKYSYGIYVLHYPVVVALFAMQKRLAARYEVLNGISAYLATLALALVACYVSALFSWSLLEKPFLSLKDKFRYQSGPDKRPATIEPRENQALATTPEAVSS